MSMEGQLPTQSHQEGTSNPTRINVNETLRYLQQSIEGLAIFLGKKMIAWMILLTKKKAMKIKRLGYSSGYDHVFRNVRRLHYTWLVPRTRASSDGTDGFILGRVDPLEEGRSTVVGLAQLVNVNTASCFAVGSASFWRARKG
ncbi:hypothetical protein M9H77_12636 [Catharanthus roseus]|uniref:Uncharacterized protein n=1 Tax=Catharanthus roseus TaxID=4058 RepID=A0ACC0BI21_CATRO|nr:hypothetical protein M9H77_12636 [Catharanthus roseus]